MKAKTIILLLTIVFISINSHAQTNVSYTYDSAGNRVSRAIVVSRGEAAGWAEDSAVELAEGTDTTSCRTIDYQESVYDILSKIQRWLPALGVAYLGLCKVWGFAYGTEVNETLMVLATLLATTLEISSVNYFKDNE